MGSTSLRRLRLVRAVPDSAVVGTAADATPSSQAVSGDVPGGLGSALDSDPPPEVDRLSGPGRAAASLSTPPPANPGQTEPASFGLRPAADAPPAAGVAHTASLDDGRLVTLARANDAAAREALYRRHAAFAINLAARLQGNLQDVEDIAHDAFVRAFTRLGDLRDIGAFRSWLGTIVVHLVRTRMRRRRLLRAVGVSGTTDAVELDAIASTDAQPDLRAQLAQVYALLLTLPADDRIAWTLRNVESHRLEEVALLAGCSLATAKRRIARAQQFLSEHFVAVGRGGAP